MFFYFQIFNRFMSEEKSDTSFYVDLILGVIGFFLLIIISFLMVYWDDNRDKLYQSYPNLAPGTFLTIGIFIGIPLLMLGTYLMLKAFKILFSYIAKDTFKVEESALSHDK